MPRPSVLLLPTLVLAFGLAACGDDATVESTTAKSDAAQSTQTSSTSSTESTPGATKAPGTAKAPAAGTPLAEGLKACAPKPEPGGGDPVPCPTATIDPSASNTVTFKTSLGSFTVTLDGKRAPATANSVAYLAKRGFYDGLDFHRVIADFVIQGGDPNGDGSGGPGYAVTEAPPSDLRYTRGVVAMAKGGADAPGASGSQFFVVTGADVGLPPDYALVGKVTKGLGVVDKITTEAAGEPPETPAKIVSATLAAG